METRLREIDDQVKVLVVSHLGDGNVHYAVWPKIYDEFVHNDIMKAVEVVAGEMGGSFSAEHGIGISKLQSMKRHKNVISLEVMQAIKTSLDPYNIMNPEKVFTSPE